MAVKDNVESTIAGNKIVVYSKSWCPYCAKAKSLIKNEYPDIKAEIIELDQVDEGSEIQSYLLDKTGQRTVPNIFINQEHIGGNDDVQAAHKAGKIKALLNV